MSDETLRPSGRRSTRRRRQRAGWRRAGFAGGGVALLVAAGLLLGGLTGGGVPGVSLVQSNDGPADAGASSGTTSPTVAADGGGAHGSGGGTGAGAGGQDGRSSTDPGAGTAGTASPASPTKPPTPPGPGTSNPTAPINPGDPAPLALPDAEKLAAAAITAGDLGGGWKQIATRPEGIGFACDAGRTLSGDTTAARALRRPGVTVTNHNFGYAGTGAADTFAAYRAAAVGCSGWRISEYARSLDIAVTLTGDSPSHLVISYQIKDRGHPTIYQVEHVFLAGNTLGIVILETENAPAGEDLLTILAGGVDAVATRLAALAV